MTERRVQSRQEKIEQSLRDSLATCGYFVADGHEEYDPECGACIAANSDAPEWTL